MSQRQKSVRPWGKRRVTIQCLSCSTGAPSTLPHMAPSMAPIQRDWTSGLLLLLLLLVVVVVVVSRWLPARM